MQRQVMRVQRFHEAFGAPVAEEPTIPPENRLELRCRLLLEETLEFISAAGFSVHIDNLTENLDDGGFYIQKVITREPNLVEMFDALKDIQVVAFGTEVECGIQDVSEEGFDEVMNSNMSKLGPDGKPILRPEDGKILKGPNYFKPNLGRFLPKEFQK